jgi:hypothetical protein
MSDALARRELEDTQMELRRLKEQIAGWPTISPEREVLALQVEKLATDVESLRARLASLHVQEANARDELSKFGPAKWWTSPPFMVLASIGALIAAFWLANVALDYLNWTYWAPLVAPVFLSVPPVVNGLRIARSWFRKRATLRLRLKG